MSNGTKKKQRETLYTHEWPEADRLGWQDACRPTRRLKKGGPASHLAPVSQHEIASRYGQFLGFLKRTGRLNMSVAAAAQVTPVNVENYMADLTARQVSSVTAWNCIYKLRRAAQLLSSKFDYDWLAEIEKDLALVMEPRSKLDRLVLTEESLISSTQVFQTRAIRRRAALSAAKRVVSPRYCMYVVLCKTVRFPSRRKQLPRQINGVDARLLLAAGVPISVQHFLN